MKNHFLVTILLVAVLHSCSENKAPGTKKENIPQEEMETEVPKIPVFPDSVVKLFAEEKIVDGELKFNAVFFDKTLEQYKKNKLQSKYTSVFIKALSKDSLSQNDSFYLDNYLKIEELKKKKKYNAYVESLDLGMMKDAEANYLYRIPYGDSIGLAIWSLSYSSYEACPYYQGQSIYGTLYHEGKIIATYLLAQREGSADAPMSSEVSLFTSLTSKGIIQQVYKSDVLEEDVVVEKNQRKYKYRLSSKGLAKK